MGLARVDIKGANDHAVAVQGQRRRSGPSQARPQRMPWRGDRVSLVVLAPEGLILAHRNADRTLALRIVGIHRDLHVVQAIQAGAVGKCRPYQPTRRVQQTHPGGHHAPVLDRSPA